MEEGRVYRVEIQGCAADGAGVARVDGMVLFVERAIRGEVVDAQVDHVGHSAAWGHMTALVEPSPARQSPDCPYYDQCGGCRFRHMDYAQELEEKRLRVEDALGRLGGCDLPVATIWGARDQLRYRNKVQFPVGPGPAVGFYRARSHAVVDVADCLLQPAAAARCRAALVEWMKRWSVPPYREKDHTGLVRHLYLRFNAAGESLCCLLVNGGSLPHEKELVAALRQAEPGLVGVVLGSNTRRTNVILGERYRLLWGQDYLEETLCGHSFRLSVPSFFQVNRAQTEVLYGRALEFAALTGKETVLDLYCGIGTISLCLARRAGRVIGAEIVPQAIEDARANAARNGVDNAEFFCGDASAVAARLAGEGLRPQVVVVDPPRKGLAADVVDTIAAMAPERVVYVSCDPATLGRDLGRFRPLGYCPVRAEAVDLFPRTAHVETVVSLVRKTPNDYIHVKLDLDDLDLTAAEAKATYSEIKEYVLEKFGLKVSSLYIAQIKEKYGIIERENYNLPKTEGNRVPKCPKETEDAIVDALKHFKMI